MARLTRGPLPARVYWVRRLLVLATAFALVFGIARLLGGGSDATSGEDAAAQVAADASSPYPASLSDLTPPSQTPGGATQHPSTADPTPTLAAPEGECSGADIAVTPEITNAAAGRDVTIVLQLRTLESEACTWQVGPRALTMDITSGKDDIWSSRECPRWIPKEPVVVRKAVTTKVEVVWKQTLRSDAGCTRRAGWALPGWYHVTAAALGGEPSDLQFELVRPTAATITKTASPTQSPHDGPGNGPSSQGSGRPLTSQGASGAGQPD